MYVIRMELLGIKNYKWPRTNFGVETLMVSYKLVPSSDNGRVQNK